MVNIYKLVKWEDITPHEVGHEDLYREDIVFCRLISELRGFENLICERISVLKGETY